MGIKKTSRILLVRTICSTFSLPELPLNLLILASSLERAGYYPEILDYDQKKIVHPELINKEFDSVQYIADDIMSHNPDCVFFTCMCNNFARTISIIKRVRKMQSGLFIGIGGPHVSMCPIDTMLAYNDFLDCVIVGEGEETIVELINGLNDKVDLKTIKGICIFEGSPIMTDKRELLSNLDDSPIPAYHLIDVNAYNTEDGKINLYVGSGCPFACSFCTTSLMWERYYRTKSIERIIEEITILKKKYNRNDFVFIHDNLTANRKFAISLVNAIRESKINIRYEISSRIDTIDEEFIRLFKMSGGTTIFFGIETGSEKMQKAIGKNLKLNNVDEILLACLNYGVDADTSFIIGFPDESLNDMESTIKLAFKCRTMLDNKVGLNLLSIYPGSPLSKSAFNDLYLDSINYDFPMYENLSAEEVVDIQNFKSIYINYYLYKSYSSGLSAVQLHRLFDYTTIVLEKYQYTFNYLINIKNYSFVKIFETQMYTIESVSAEDKDRFNYEIDEEKFVEDIREIIEPGEANEIIELLKYDSKINTFYELSLYNRDILYYQTFKFYVDIDNNCLVAEGADPMYYMILAKNGNMFTAEINSSIYDDIDKIKDLIEVEAYLSEELNISI